LALYKFVCLYVCMYVCMKWIKPVTAQSSENAGGNDTVPI